MTTCVERKIEELNPLVLPYWILINMHKKERKTQNWSFCNEDTCMHFNSSKTNVYLHLQLKVQLIPFSLFYIEQSQHVFRIKD